MGRVSRWELSPFYKLLSEVIFHHFYCIISIRSKSLGPAHTQEEGAPHRCPHLLGTTLVGIQHSQEIEALDYESREAGPESMFSNQNLINTPPSFMTVA